MDIKQSILSVMTLAAVTLISAFAKPQTKTARLKTQKTLLAMPKTT